MTIKPGWLASDCALAAAQVALWPRWEREWCNDALRTIRRSDPCLRRRACQEAQTCVGECQAPPHQPARSRTDHETGGRDGGL